MAAPDHCGPPGPVVSPVAVLQQPWLRNSTTAPSCELQLRVLLPGSSSLRALRSFLVTGETITTPPPNVYSGRHRFLRVRRSGNRPRTTTRTGARGGRHWITRHSPGYKHHAGTTGHDDQDTGERDGHGERQPRYRPLHRLRRWRPRKHPGLRQRGAQPYLRGYLRFFRAARCRAPKWHPKCAPQEAGAACPVLVGPMVGVGAPGACRWSVRGHRGGSFASDRPSVGGDRGSSVPGPPLSAV
jgi:hypothetical protein